MTRSFDNSVLNLDSNVHIVYQQITDKEFFFILKVESHQAVCPTCSSIAQRVHSRYTRNIIDLPAGGTSVHLQLLTKKWFCDRPTCKIKVFTERLHWLHPYARKTNRLEETIRHIGFSTNCLTAEKVCQMLGIPISHDAILRRLKEPINKPEVNCPFRRHR